MNEKQRSAEYTQLDSSPDLKSSLFSFIAEKKCS